MWGRRSLKLPWLASVGLLLCAGASVAAELLPRPQAIEPAVQFWTRVYSEVGTDGGFIHDARYLDVVYAVVERAGPRELDAATRHYRDILRALGRGEPPSSDEARRVLELWRAHGAEALAGAGERVRFQRGQANRFRDGVTRSGRWRDYIVETLREAGVPEVLAALPHVESSFDPTARSHADAWGLWQFTRSTGQRFMQIDHVVDERLDPSLSTRAAAQLLRYNYDVTGEWPLAITAYNHGSAGMRRAVEQLGTRDIGVIHWDYRGRSFGFASRNFYPAFLAAVDVEARADELFGPVRKLTPRAERVAAPPDYVSARALPGASPSGAARSAGRGTFPCACRPGAARRSWTWPWRPSRRASVTTGRCPTPTTGWAAAKRCPPSPPATAPRCASWPG